MTLLNAFSAIVLDTALKATVLLLVAWGGVLILKNRSAALRHAVLAFAVAALLLLPFSSVVLPAWHVRGIPTFVSPETTSTAAVQSHPAATYASARTPVAPVLTTNRATPRAMPQTNRQAPLAQSAMLATPIPNDASPVMSSITPAQNAKPAVVLPISAPSRPWSTRWTPALMSLWIAGALFCIGRWRMSVLRLAGLVRRAAVLTDSGWNEQVRALAGDLAITRHVALLVSDETEVPITSGILFPRIILSPDYSEWSATRRSAILNHELAHIKRLDALTQTVSHLVTALYWFHPLAWLTVRAIRAERERACDDHVLATGTKASEYAHELLDIVSGLRQPELTAALAMARRSQLEGRVLAVLNPKLPRSSVSRMAAIFIAVLTVSIVLPLSALRPVPQASTPAARPSAARAGRTTPSPSARPAIASTPAAVADESQPVIASTPRASSYSYAVASSSDAPEPPEPRQTPEASEAPEAPEATQAVGGVPAVPGVPSVPAVPAVPAAPGSDMSICGTRAKHHNMDIEDNNGYRRWIATWSGDDCSLDLRAEGEIKFNADATDIQSISSGGYFEVNERHGDTLRQIKVTPSASGLQYVFKINGNQHPMGGETKAWFSAFLLALERSTGFSADTRVPALLGKGGPTAVLDEINNLQSNYVRGIYFRKLLEQPKLPALVVQRVIKQAGEHIGSDYELARVLMTVSKQYDLPDEASRTAFLTATGKLKSDYEHARVLIELLKRPNISRENVRMALDSSASLKSDYEKSRILLSLMDQKSFDQSSLDFYLKMVASIHSDYEKSRDLLAPMQRYTLAANQIDQIIAATAAMSADYEKSRLLITLAEKGKFDEGQMGNYLKVVDSMRQEYERSRSLLELMNQNKLSDASLRRVLEAAGHIKSDYEKARVLLNVAHKYSLEGSLRNIYIDAANSITNEYERNRALAAVVKRATL